MTNGFQNDKIQVIIEDNSNRSHFCISCFERKVTHGKFAKRGCHYVTNREGVIYTYDAVKRGKIISKKNSAPPWLTLTFTVLHFQY